MKMPIKVGNIEYTALFVDSPEKLLKMFEPKHKNIYAHHSTNWYKPTDVSDLEIGKKSALKIIGRAYDQSGDALLVENGKSKNKYPHITISCAENVPLFIRMNCWIKSRKMILLNFLKNQFLLK